MTLAGARAPLYAVVLSAICWGLQAGATRAAPEEIQVYLDDISAPGHFGLDLHTNFVAAGAGGADYPRGEASLDRFRLTPEFAYGLTHNLEAGLYLPLATIDGSGRPSIDGAKVRLKFIAPRAADQTWFWGANFEIGGVDHRLDPNPWNAELKGIVGRRWGPWTLAFNANVDFKLAGPEPAPASLELDAQLTYQIDRTLSVGLETYNGAGEFRRLGAFASAEQSTFLVMNKSLGRWDINLGIGAGYGANRDSLIVKAIIGVPID